MVRFQRLAVAVLGIVAFAGCSKSDTAGSDTTAVVAGATPVTTADAAADDIAIRAINPAWFKAHAAGDVDAIAALYSDDAILSIPGAAPIRGIAGIREALQKDFRDMAAAGLSQTSGTSPEFGVSGDIGHEWNTYILKDKSGKTIDTGKYLSVFARRNGKWMIIRDIWNSDMPPTPAT